MALFSNLKEIIKLGDDLRDCKIEKEINLPRICVIGVQSSGKSSLLESIVGFDFLPRGEGVVTRMPLELRLVRLNESADEDLKPWASFDGENEKITDLSLIKDMILQKQEQKSANQPKSKKIIDDPIVLTIYSPHVANLSLVDLPGITRVAIGDQDKNIEQITKDMARRYIKEPRTIILCVTPANTDLATSDSIQMAQEVDPSGERTLGVLTKLDLMDPGTDAMKILTNREIELKHGYIAVKNRSQKDINNGMLVEEALAREEEWFSAHKVYGPFPDVWGSKRLSEKLSELLYQQIVTSLPSIEKEIYQTLTKSRKDLENLGEPLPQEEGMKYYYFSKLIDSLEGYVSKAIAGRVPLGENICEFQGLSEFRLMIGEFNKSKSMLFTQGLKAAKLHEMIIDILEYKKMDLPGFLPSEVLADRVRRELDALKYPLDKFIERVYEKDQKVLKWAFGNMNIINEEIKTFFEKEAYGYLKELVDTTRKFIYDILEVEKDIVWTSDASILERENHEEKQPQGQENGNHVQSNSVLGGSGGGSNSGSQKIKPDTVVKPEQKSNLVISFSTEEIREALLLDSLNPKSLPEKYQKKLEQLKRHNLKVNEILTEREVLLFYETLSKYFTIIDRNLSDLIPKTIGSYLMIGFHRKLKDHIFKRITDNSAYIRNLRESPSVEKKRAYLKQLITKLEKAHDAIKETKFKIGLSE